MYNPYEIPIAPTTLMCGTCKGIGTVGGYLSPEELCKACNGAGLVQKGREDDE